MSKPQPNRHAPTEVDEYVAAQGEGFRETLEELRAIVRRVAPDCSERVSYKIPIFRLKKDFVAMSAAKKHIGFHTMSNGIPVAMKDEFKAAGVWISGTTFRIKPGAELPVALIEKALRVRLDELEAGK